MSAVFTRQAAAKVDHQVVDRATSPRLPSPRTPFASAGRRLGPDKLRDEELGSEPQRITMLFTIVSYAILMMWGYIREAFRLVVKDQDTTNTAPPGYARIYRGSDDFFSRRIIRRVRDCLNRPINTRAGRIIGVMERRSDEGNKNFEFTGRTIPCINLASYNYLGFSEDIPAVTDSNLEAIEKFGTGSCASCQEGGQSTVLRDLELEIAEFVGKESAVVFAMGFVTNFSGLAPLFDAGTLVISDSLNHASLIGGIRNSTAGQVKVFKHNDIDMLERVIRRSIVEGRPRLNRAWTRIVIVVEGIYSMEGEILDLPRLVALKKKYNCLLYVDEAHSIGALGRRGRGVCEHYNVDPADVDLLMGTFTKSFGSIGGYIAGPKYIVDALKRHSGANLIGDTLHSASAQQALTSLRVMQGKDGTTIGREKIQQLKANATYMRQRLREMRLIILGQDESPVIPIMMYQPGKLAVFSRELLARHVAVVVVGYPATPLMEARCRLCVSAAHTREDLDRALSAIDEVATLVGLRYQYRWPYYLLV